MLHLHPKPDRCSQMSEKCYIHGNSTYNFRYQRKISMSTTYRSRIWDLSATRCLYLLDPTKYYCFVWSLLTVVDCVWNVMAHVQKPELVFRRNGRVHLNRRGCQFSRLLAAEMCTSAVVMLDTPCSEGAWEYWLPTPFVSFPFTSPSVCHRVPSGFNRTLQPSCTVIW